LGWWKNSWWGIGWFGTHSWNWERKDLGCIVNFCIICVMWEWDKIVFAGFCCLSNLFWVYFLCVCMDDLFIYLCFFDFYFGNETIHDSVGISLSFASFCDSSKMFVWNNLLVFQHTCIWKGVLLIRLLCGQEFPIQPQSKHYKLFD